ncbi:MAG: type III-B CRISPR module RAMP protein Cmr1 [Lentisphaerae bacterium]|jgi:CRISPR type III-B/RAMP module RAMP protein Cmr1|nr:type III-B CRISPR module RAMP protein Cmr1 [Lentisphaerota bacterium]
MKINLDVISPALCGGAVPEEKAEIRAASVRGQLRWWFRLLGGFKSLQQQGMGVREQEDMIFGVVRGQNCEAGKLQVRTRMRNNAASEPKEFDRNNPAPFGSGYFLFPMRNNRRAIFLNPLPQFELFLNWRGDPALEGDIAALGYLYGYLGSLGMRSRRAMGALSFAQGQGAPIPAYNDVISRFAKPNNITVKELPMRNNDNVISVLASWLRSWRAYMNENRQRNEGAPGFRYAQNDHDVGYRPNDQGQPTYRPTLGLPIIQRLGRMDTCHWEFSSHRGTARFASPVILRPYTTSKGQKKALVIFVDAYTYPEGNQVYLHYGRARRNLGPKVCSVSHDLYRAMKNDNRLKPFRHDR